MGSDHDTIKSQSYFRLLKYASPYKFRLIVGILAGFVVGGSLFGSLMMVTPIMEGVDSSAGKDSKELSEKLEKVVLTVQSGESVVLEDQKDTVKKIIYSEDNKISKSLAEIKKYSEKFHLPVEVSKAEIRWTWLVPFSLPVEDKNGLMSWQFFMIYVLIFVLAWVLKNIATYINRYYTRWVGTKVIADLRDEAFRKLMNQSLRFYGKMDVGQLISRCTNDTAAIESAVANSVADATRCPLEILACIIAILVACRNHQNFSLLIILFIGVPVCVLPVVLLGRKVRKIYKSAFARIADVLTKMHEVFTGIIIVKAYNTENSETNTFKGINRKYFRTVVRALKLQLLMAPLMEVVAVTSTLVFLVYSYSQGVTLTQLAQLMVPAFMAYRPIKSLAKVTNYIQRSMAAADRYFDLIDIDTSIKEKVDPIRITDFEREIAFNDVSFSYDDGRKILDGINLKIPKGEVVAVVGETGSGKTTIANLIARFYDVDSGSVSIDGKDVRDLKIVDLRDLIGIVNQDPILFNDTIKSNIAYGQSEVSFEQVVDAAKKANAHEFIVDGRHADGYDMMAGEKGFNLSGGEKQRISIARAILKNPPILILDEATSALDTVTERLVQNALNNLMENRTVFAIAHRLSTIKHANKIIVLDKGKIIESGSHDELLAQNGRYRKLYDTQFER
jgi:subfamily B ATP-binding cassette protein MsbA